MSTKVKSIKRRTDETTYEDIILSQYVGKTFDFTLTSGGWSSTSPYTQTIGVSGVTATMEGTVGVSRTATEAQYKAAAKAQLRCTAQAANSLTFTAYGTKPTESIPCHMTNCYEPIEYL